MFIFPFSFGNLKHLLLACPIDLNDKFFQFIGSLKNLSTLTVVNFRFTVQSGHRKFLEFQSMLSNVEELNIALDNRVSPEDVLSFLTQSKRLKCLTLICENENHPNHLLYEHGIDNKNVKDCRKIVQKITLNLDFRWKYNVVNPFKVPFRSWTPHFATFIKRISLRKNKK